MLHLTSPPPQIMAPTFPRDYNFDKLECTLPSDASKQVQVFRLNSFREEDF